MSPAAVEVEDRVPEKESSPEGKSDVSTYAIDDFSPASGKHSGVRSLSMFSHGAVLPTAVCLSKAAIGAGVLTMPGHAAEVGLVFQTSSLIGGAVLYTGEHSFHGHGLHRDRLLQLRGLVR